MVPEGWRASEVGEHVELLSGFPFKSSDYSDDPEDIRLLRGDNIGQGQLRWRDARRWDKERLDELVKYQLVVGDFVIAMDRTWVTNGLKVAEVRNQDVPSLLLQRVSRLRAYGTLDQRLLRFYINSHRFEQYVKSVQTETAVPHISAKQIKEFPIPIPPLPEQRKIADILSTWDGAIENTEALLANARTQKRALMQSLLTGKRRFPEFEGHTWQKTRLRDHCTLKGGFGFTEEHQGQSKGDLPFIKVSDMNLECNKVEILTANNWLSHCTAEKIKVRPFPKDAVVFAKVGAALMLNRRRILTRPTVIDNNMMAATANQTTHPRFLYHLLCRIDLGRLAQVGAVPSVNQTELGAIKVTFPSIEEQEKISAFLDVVDGDIVSISQGIKKLRTEKKALMQQLLTGKRRVVV